MILSVLNLKGGTTKTTTAMALATAALLDGKKARVLDADPQSSATAWYYNALEAERELIVPVEPANTMLVKRLATRPTDEWVIIDCPPNGQVLDEAMKAADFIVVPTTASRADVDKTLEAVATLRENEKSYAVLVTRAEVNMLNHRSVMAELAENAVSHFDAVIRKNVKIADAYKTGFGSELYGYDEVFNEIKQALEVE